MSEKHQHEHHYGQYDLGLKAFIRSLQIAFFAMVILIVGTLVYFFAFGGFVVAKPNEAVLILRFGDVVGKPIKNSWTWAFPRPVNEFVRIPLNQQSFSVSFEAQKMPTQAGMPPQGGPLEPGRDHYLLTGDVNIIHSNWIVTYNVVKPRKYYENVISALSPFLAEHERQQRGKKFYPGGPVFMLQNLLRNVVIKVTAVQSVEQTLYDKQKYLDQVKNEFQKVVRDLDLGIKIENVSGDASAPLKTKMAFDDVSNARQDREKMFNEALSYKVTQENAALSEKAMIVARAKNYQTRVVSEVEAETIYFKRINEEYKLSPETVLVSLYNYTLSDVLSATKEKFIIYKSGKGKQEVRLKINPEPKVRKNNK